MKNVPEIRFKGFEEEWNQYLIKNVASRHDNLRIPIKESKRKKGNVPYYGANGIQDYVSGYTHNGEYVLVAEDGANDLNIYPVQYVNGKVWVNNHAHVLQAKCEYGTNKFLRFAISNLKIKPYLVGCGRLKLNSEVLMTLGIKLPKLDSQVIISKYLYSQDDNIINTSKKIASLKQLKSACLISMFPQQGETVPRVRFKGFNGEWKKKKLNSFASRITRKNSKLESKLPVTISALNGIIEQTMFFNNIVASSNLSGYYLMKKGEFAYNKSYSCGFPFGAVKRMDRYEMGALSNLYIVFKLEDTVCDDYILYLFETSTWHKEVSMRASEGARNHGLLNIGAEDFLDIDIWVPNDKAEQHQIASYFRNLDIQISEQEKRLEKLKQIKAACLDKMFV